MRLLEWLFVILLLATPAMAGVNVTIINSSSTPSPVVDVQWIISTVTPYLEQMSVPQRDSVTVEFEDNLGGATSVCAGHSYIGGNLKPTNVYDITDVTNQIVIHEYILARFTPCALDYGSDDLVEGFGNAKTNWMYRRMNPSGYNQTGVNSLFALEALPWLAGGGTYSFYTNLGKGIGYDCIAGPIERLGALTGGDYRAIDTAITNLPIDLTNFNWAGSPYRGMFLSAIDSALSPMKVDGALPSTLLREVRCSWETMAPRSDTIYLTYDEPGFQLFFTLVTEHDGTTSKFVLTDTIGPVWYSIADSNGKTVESDTVDSTFAVVYGQAYGNAPTGAYIRKSCVLGSDGNCLAYAKDTQFSIQYKEPDALSPFSPLSPNQLVIITNGPDFAEFSADNFSLAGPSVGKFSVRHFPGLFVVDNAVGDVWVTDGVLTKVFTVSSNAATIKTWTRYDDVRLTEVLDAKTLQPKKGISAGDVITLSTVGATHGDPTPNVNSVGGCVNVNGTTNVLFTTGKFIEFGVIKSCSWGSITVEVPVMRATTGSDVNIAVRLNDAMSNTISLQAGITGTTNPSRGVGKSIQGVSGGRGLSPHP